jgi:hypothetical protein
MGSFSEDSSEKNKLIIGIWAGVYLTTPSLLPPALNACYTQAMPWYVYPSQLVFLYDKDHFPHFA